MQESPQLEEERKLERRGRIGCLLAFALAGVIMGLVTALPQSLFPLQPMQPGWLVLLSSLVPMVVIFTVGIVGVVLMFRLMFWSLEAERRRQQRGTAVFRQMLPGLSLDQAAPMPAPTISSRQLGKLLLLFLLFLVGAMLAVSVAGAILDRTLPGLPGIVRSILTIAFGLGAIGLVEWMIKRLRTTPAAAAANSPATLPATRPAQEQARPGRKRVVGIILYCILAFVPLIAVLFLIFRFPAPRFLMPILALGVCAVVLVVITAIYMIAPFLWIAGAVKACQYDKALARVQQVENLSIFPGFYLNLHGVILLWAGRYEEARKTFEESIGEQRKEVMGGGSAALENIGCALAWQGNYEESIKMFEGSIAISQQQVMVYSDLAEALLHQGAELPRALELTEHAWENQQASLESRWLSAHQGGQILANRAWALAKLGREQQAEDTLARAFAVADESFTPVLAGIHLRAGYVMLARGEQQKAEEYFKEGQRLDPHGHYGRLCVEKLKHAH